MGSLTKDVDAAKPAKKITCNYCLWYEGLDSEDKKTADEIMSSPEWDGMSLFRFFRSHGCKAGETSIRKHRADGCEQRN